MQRGHPSSIQSSNNTRGIYQVDEQSPLFSPCFSPRLVIQVARFMVSPPPSFLLLLLLLQLFDIFILLTLLCYRYRLMDITRKRKGRPTLMPPPPLFGLSLLDTDSINQTLGGKRGGWLVAGTGPYAPLLQLSRTLLLLLLLLLGRNLDLGHRLDVREFQVHIDID